MKYGFSYFVLIFLFSVNILFADGENSEESLSEHEGCEVTPMTNVRMHHLLERIDPELQGQLGSWLLQYDNLTVQVITDENADRMRVIVPILKAEDLNDEELVRMMQANFDSVLDARYSIANGVLWSAFIHPFSILSDEEFISGLAQAITAAATFGSTYSSGALIFRGGDSDEQQQDYYESIIEKGLEDLKLIIIYVASDELWYIAKRLFCKCFCVFPLGTDLQNAAFVTLQT